MHSWYGTDDVHRNDTIMPTTEKRLPSTKRHSMRRDTELQWTRKYKKGKVEKLEEKEAAYTP